MNDGIVRWFSVKMGYGFITGDCGRNIFVHYKNIMGNGTKNLNANDRVKFDLYENEKGYFAVNVYKI